MYLFLFLIEYNILCYLFFFYIIAMSPGSDSLASVDTPAVSEMILQTLNELAKSFLDMSDRCLLVLHLEVRFVDFILLVYLKPRIYCLVILKKYKSFLLFYQLFCFYCTLVN